MHTSCDIDGYRTFRWTSNLVKVLDVVVVSVDARTRLETPRLKILHF